MIGADLWISMVYPPMCPQRLCMTFQTIAGHNCQYTFPQNLSASTRTSSAAPTARILSRTLAMATSRNISQVKECHGLLRLRRQMLAYSQALLLHPPKDPTVATCRIPVHLHGAPMISNMSKHIRS